MSSVPPNSLLIKLANAISNLCKKICIQTSNCLSNNVNFPGILHAKESQVFHLISCLENLQIRVPISSKGFAFKQLFAFPIMCIFQVYFMQQEAKCSSQMIAYKPCKLEIQFLQKSLHAKINLRF